MATLAEPGTNFKGVTPLRVRMSVTGLCQICTDAEADESCRLCGKLVCERHYEESVAQCVECTAEHGQGDGKTSQENLPDGVDTYRF